MSDSLPATEPASRSARRPRWQRYALEAGLFVLIIGAVQAWHARDVPQGPAPAFAATLASGGETSLKGWRAAHPGRAVAVYFWADWCPICRAQQGSIDELGRDWPVLTVAMQSGDGAAVSRVLRERGLTWTTAVDADGRIAAQYGLHGVPALAIIDARGTLRAMAVGYTTEAGMRARMWWAQHGGN